jgi:hypothetical protein
VALFAGAAIQAILAQVITLRVVVSAMLVGSVGVVLLAFAIILSKEA